MHVWPVTPLPWWTQVVRSDIQYWLLRNAGWWGHGRPPDEGFDCELTKLRDGASTLRHALPRLRLLWNYKSQHRKIWTGVCARR